MDSAQKRQLRQARLEGIAGITRQHKLWLAGRLAETRRLFKKRVHLADLHTHSNYSDGSSTVAENSERAMLVGLDFMFATDHSCIRQKRCVRNLPLASWGQESSAGRYHAGLLHASRVHQPTGEGVAADIAAARKIAPFVWIAHAAGFSDISAAQVDQIVEELGTVDDLAMEVLNGYNAVDRCFHRSGKGAVKAWDKLLCAGKKFTPVGASDTHSILELGNAWTGVFAPQCTAESIIKTLNAGRCFSSEASLLDFSCNGKPMGSSIRPRGGSPLKFSFRVADSAGLASVRIVSQGRVVKTLDARGSTLVNSTLTRKAGRKRTYYRLESTAIDDRRAFSAPIYVGT